VQISICGRHSHATGRGDAFVCVKSRKPWQSNGATQEFPRNEERRGHSCYAAGGASERPAGCEAPTAAIRLARHGVCWHVIASLLLFTATSSAADESAAIAEGSVAARRLDQMRERANRATVRIVSDGPQTKHAAGKAAEAPSKELPEVQFEKQPVFRYSDPPRGFRDCTLWMWTSNGRPVALEKVEDWRRSPPDGASWITCFASLYPGLIEVNWHAGPQWTSQKPGLQFQLVEDFERPEATEAGRLRQFKKLSERFSIAIERDYSGKLDSQEMRRLPRHLHRYHVPNQSVTDAVMFGWTTNGTNPDAMVVIELRTTGDKHGWYYAMAQVTADKVVLSLDGKSVQEQDRNITGTGPTLRYFFERNSTPID